MGRAGSAGELIGGSIWTKDTVAESFSEADLEEEIHCFINRVHT